MPGITEYQRLMEQKTRSTVNTVAEQFKTFVETQEKIDKLPETLTFEKGLVRKAGLTRTGGKIDNFADHLKDFSEKLSEYSADAKILEKEKLQNYIPQKGIKPKYDKLVQDVLDKYGVQNPKEAYEMIIARKSIGAKYQTELNSLNKILDEIRTKDKVLNELNGKFGKLRRNAKDLNIAESRIRGKFKEFLGKAESSMETVAGMSKEDAANILPLGMHSKMVLRINARTLIEMSHQRECSRAYWEFRELFRDLKTALHEYSDEWATIVDCYFKPKCEFFGYCNERKPCKKKFQKEEEAIKNEN